MGGEARIPALGFLTVIEDTEHGLFGGYLVLNLIGRPLEFHCTAPVKPNRAQEILYGPTLAPYLYGEQIAQALIRKGTVAPRSVFTNQSAVLAARDLVEMPIVLVGDDELTGAERPSNSPRHCFMWGQQKMAVAVAHGSDERPVLDQLADVAPDFDLTEPFQRIREAIAEASRS